MSVMVIKGAATMTPEQMRFIAQQHERMLGHAESMVQAALKFSPEVNHLAQMLTDMVHERAVDACTTEKTPAGPIVNTAVLMGAYVQVCGRLMAMLWDMPERDLPPDEPEQLHKLASMQAAAMQSVGMACAILNVDPEMMRAAGVAATLAEVRAQEMGHG